MKSSQYFTVNTFGSINTCVYVTPALSSSIPPCSSAIVFSCQPLRSSATYSGQSVLLPLLTPPKKKSAKQIKRSFKMIEGAQKKKKSEQFLPACRDRKPKPEEHNSLG